MKGSVFDIQRASYVDGPGIRTTVFLKGCHMNCAWCHNPEGKRRGTQRMYFESKCLHCGKCAGVCRSGAISFVPSSGALGFSPGKCVLCGRCALICPQNAISLCGYETDSGEILDEVKKDIGFYNDTGGGVTLSGGECLDQPDFTAEILEKCKEAGISTAVDTAGDVPWESIEKVLPYTDLFLYDIKCITPSLHRKFTGVGNQRIMENYRRLLSLGVGITVRVPLIAGFNDSDAESGKITAFLRENPPGRVEFLPYHAMGENKYRALGPGEPEKFSAPSQEVIGKLQAAVKSL